MSAFSQYFTGFDYTLSLPMVLLTLFSLGVLLIDLMLPAEWKRLNAVTALLGVAFSAVALFWRIQVPYRAAQEHGVPLYRFTHGFGGTIAMDSFAIYFFYLFLAAGAITILMSTRYLEVEKENHGEFYALIML